MLDAAEAAALDVGVHLSCNLTGGVFVNQSAAFSDFHASGANPAANASLTDGAYVANRFRIVQSRRQHLGLARHGLPGVIKSRRPGVLTVRFGLLRCASARVACVIGRSLGSQYW